MENNINLIELLEYIEPSFLDYQDWVKLEWRLNMKDIQYRIGIIGANVTLTVIMPGNVRKSGILFPGSSSPITAGTIVKMAQD